MEAFPDAILIIRDFHTTFVNPATVELFGVSRPDQILGRSIVDLFAAEHREAVTNSIERSLRGQRMPQTDARIVAAGATRDVEVAVVAVPIVGEPAASVALIVRDVTERRRAELTLKESEERLKLAFAGAQEGVWDWDLETGAVVYSRAVEARCSATATTRSNRTCVHGSGCFIPTIERLPER